MSGRFFIDTNVFVYSLDRSSPKKSTLANDLIRRAVESKKGVVSYQVVQELFHIALRKFVQPMTVADAEQYLAITLKPLLTVQSSSLLYSEALRIYAKYKTPWYDSLILASAHEGECDIVYSEDFQDGRSYGDVKVTNPFAGI